MSTGTGKAGVAGSQQTDNPNAKVLQDYTNGAGHVTDGVSGVLSARLMNAAAAIHPGADVSGANTNGRTWTEAEGVTKLFITVTATTSDITINIFEEMYCDIVIDAPNGTVASALLSATSTADAVGEGFVKIRVPFNTRISDLPISTSAIRRIDVLPTVEAFVLVEAY